MEYPPECADEELAPEGLKKDDVKDEEDAEQEPPAITRAKVRELIRADTVE